jgi:hypothetical protein
MDCNTVPAAHLVGLTRGKHAQQLPCGHGCISCNSHRPTGSNGPLYTRTSETVNGDVLQSSHNIICKTGQKGFQQRFDTCVGRRKLCSTCHDWQGHTCPSYLQLARDGGVRETPLGFAALYISNMCALGMLTAQP